MASWLSVTRVSVSTSKFPDLQANKTRLKNVRRLHPSLKFREKKIFLASSGSFTVKNDNIHSFFSFRSFGCKF